MQEAQKIKDTMVLILKYYPKLLLQPQLPSLYIQCMRPVSVALEFVAAIWWSNLLTFPIFMFPPPPRPPLPKCILFFVFGHHQHLFTGSKIAPSSSPIQLQNWVLAIRISCTIVSRQLTLLWLTMMVKESDHGENFETFINRHQPNTYCSVDIFKLKLKVSWEPTLIKRNENCCFAAFKSNCLLLITLFINNYYKYYY